MSGYGSVHWFVARYVVMYDVVSIGGVSSIQPATLSTGTHHFLISNSSDQCAVFVVDITCKLKRDFLFALLQSGYALEVACNGCRAQCQGCTFDESLVVPICTQDIPHSTSSGGRTTLENVSISPGFWRATSTSTNVLACYKDEPCLGGVTGAPGYCLDGYEGPCEPPLR